MPLPLLCIEHLISNSITVLINMLLQTTTPDKTVPTHWREPRFNGSERTMTSTARLHDDAVDAKQTRETKESCNTELRRLDLLHV